MNEAGLTQEIQAGETIFGLVPVPTTQEVYGFIPPGEHVSKDMYRVGVNTFTRMEFWAADIRPTVDEEIAVRDGFIKTFPAFQKELDALLRNDDFLNTVLHHDVNSPFSTNLVVESLQHIDPQLAQRIATTVVEGVDPEILKLCLIKSGAGVKAFTDATLDELRDSTAFLEAQKRTGMLFTHQNNPALMPAMYMNGLDEPLWQKLQPQAEAVDRGRYLLHTLRVVQEIWREEFPEFPPAEVKRLEMYDQQHPGHFKADGRCQANGEWDHAKRTVRLASATTVKSLFPEIYDEKTLASVGTIILKRRVNDIRIMSHEWAHTVFDALVYDSPGIDREAVEVDNSLSGMFTEGFALLMEYLTLRVMKDNPSWFGLAQDDLDAIQQWREARGDWLDDRKNKYQHKYLGGLVGVFWPIFESGSGPLNERGIRGGLQAVREFIGQIDGVKLASTNRQDDQFLHSLLIDYGNATAWLKQVGVDIAEK